MIRCKTDHQTMERSTQDFQSGTKESANSAYAFCANCGRIIRRPNTSDKSKLLEITDQEDNILAVVQPDGKTLLSMDLSIDDVADMFWESVLPPPIVVVKNRKEALSINLTTGDIKVNIPTDDITKALFEKFREKHPVQQLIRGYSNKTN